MGTMQVAGLQRVSTTLRPRSGSEAPVTEIPGGALLAHGNYVLGYHGLFHGEGVLEELRCYCSRRSAVVYGFERVTGSIGDHSGSFVLQHVGRLENGVLKSRRTVIPGCGSGAFINLRGEIDFADCGGMEYPILFEYSLQ